MDTGIGLLNQVLLKLNEVYNRRLRGRTGIDVMDEDWDNLLILDACRYDVFSEVNTLPGELEPVISKGSNTVEWLCATFDAEEYPDIVYVAANGNIGYLDAKFHRRIRLMDPEYKEDSWDDELGIVPPNSVVDAALAAQERYPNKRLIVHFLQPHQPFIGKTGRELLEDGTLKHTLKGRNFWQQLADRDINPDRVRRAYRENLELILPRVERLHEGLIGKSVVTSDHGNAFGTLGVYGHPAHTYLKGLVEVPWLELPYEERKTITTGSATDGPVDVSDEVKDRLTQLGYAK